jgi:hypothetical protein
MSFIDEMNQIKAEHDNQIKEKRDAFHTSVRKRNKQMKELIDENLKIVEDGGTTGDEIIDVILRGRKHVDVYSDRLSIPREGAISYTLNLRKELEENRGKFVGSETKREEPIEFITFNMNQNLSRKKLSILIPIAGMQELSQEDFKEKTLIL